MAKNHKKSKNPKFSKDEARLIKATNDLIHPFGIVTGLGPHAIGVLGDARSVGVAVLVKFTQDANVPKLSTSITNRVKGVTRVLMDIGTI